METVKEKIANIGLFAGLPVADEDSTLQAVEALVEGKISGILLLWSKQNFAVLEKLHSQFPNLLIGVQGPWAQVSQTLDKGADFVVSSDIPANELGNACLKREGDRLISWQTGKVLADCSDKLVVSTDIEKGAWAAITSRAQTAVQEMLGFELLHVGINNPDAETSGTVAGKFEQIFGFPKQDKGGAYFAGSYIESMKKPFYGTHGHIAIGTNYAARAVWYLQQRGVAFNWKSAGYNPDGSLRVIYLQDEIGGFAVHVLQK
ncbi:MAG: hypothetical protein J6Y25_04380 [Elusimicrobiaceae bacterium]|nr:hypothetical protein [Elusimicrobiaceae bacterium]MBP5616790.1 hypothetical protein [Elusimicrobiaceae bacterium]